MNPLLVRAAHIASDHTQRTATAGLVRVVAQAITFGLSLVAGMVLARLLQPQDFGLFAMGQWLVALVTTFRDFGLPVATIHANALDQRQMSALFWLSVRLSVGVLLLMLLAAPALAWFYGQPVLTWVVVACAAALFTGGLATQHDALLARQLRFGAIARVEVLSLGVSLAVALGMAWAGFGVWALVGQFTTQHVARTVGIWAAARWWPTWNGVGRAHGAPLDDDVRAMVTFGLRATGARLVTYLGRNMDIALVGALHGATALGFYQNAYRWSTLPVQQVYLPLLNVAVSSLSRVRDLPQQYRQTALGLLLPLFGLSMPLLTYFAVDAERVVLLLLGGQWLPSVPLLRVLCVGSLLGMPLLITKWLYLSVGDTRRQLRWSVIQTAVMVLAVLVGARWGALGVAVGFTAGTGLLVVPALLACLHVTPLSAQAMLGILWRPVVASLMAVVPTGWVDSAFTLPLLAALFMNASVYGLTYATAWLVLPGGRGQLALALRWLRAAWPKKHIPQQ